MKKEAEAYAKAITRAEKSMKDMSTLAAKIGGELFNLSVNDFFKEVERSPELMKRLQDEVVSLRKELSTTADEMNKSFYEDKLKGKSSFDVLLKQVKKLETEFPEASKAMIEELEEIQSKGKPIQDFKFSKVFEKAGFEAADFANELLKGSVAADKIADAGDRYGSSVTKIIAVRKELEKTTTEVFSLTNAMESFVKKTFAIDKIIGAMTNFDKIINETQRNFGIEMDSNVGKMSEMVIEGARFGQSAESMGKFMGQLGNTLNTTNFDLLGKAAEDTVAIAAATGLANDEVAKLTGQFMLMGKSSEDVKDFVQTAANESRRFGLNTKKVIEDVSKNVSKFRQMGFQGGEESLKKMVITAQRLRMSVDEIFNVAEKARSIEGAMEMAADLQLAGGSFSQIDPMQLLSAARKGPEELTKILGEMGKDIGTFNKETGEIKFDAIDADRLAMVSKATGMSVEALQNQIAKGKQTIAKETGGLFAGMGGMDEDTKAMVDQMTTIGKNGKIEFTGAFAKEDMQSFRSLSQAQIKERLADYTKNKDTLEEQAKQNMAFTDALKNLTDSFMNVFTLFQPLIEGLTYVVNKFNSAGPVLKEIIVAFVAGVMLFRSSIIQQLIGGFFPRFSAMIGGLGDKLKGMFGDKFKNIVFNRKEEAADMGGDKVKSGMFGGMDADKIKAIGSAAKEAAPGILALGAAILMVGGGIAIAAVGLAQLVKSFAELDSATQVAGAVAAVAVVMGGFVAIVYAMAGAVAALGAAGTAGAVGLLALGAAFLMIGGGIALASLGMSKLVESFAMLSGVQIAGALGSLIVIMGGFTAMVFALGAASTVAGPGLLFLGGAFLMIGGGIALASLGMSKFVEAISQLKPEVLSGMGSGLMSFTLALGGLVVAMFGAIPAIIGLGAVGLLAAPGLLALGLAFTVLGGGISLATIGVSQFNNSMSKLNPNVLSGMGTGLISFSAGLGTLTASMFAFANPVSLFVFGAMVVALSSLAGVMNVLGPNLEKGGEGMSALAKGVTELSTALSNVNTDTLDKLKSIGESTSQASSLTQAVNSIVGAISGGGASSTGTPQRFELEVIVKTESGRELQRKIIKDTDLIK